MMTKFEVNTKITYRIIDPCNRVQELKDFPDDNSALAWLLTVRAKRHDPFLEVQKQLGHKWVAIVYPPPDDFKNFR